MVVESVDGEDLLLLDLCEAEDSRDLVIAVFELALVKQNLDVAIVNDGLLYDGRIDDVIQLLGDNTGDAMELADGLIEVFDVSFMDT